MLNGNTMKNTMFRKSFKMLKIIANKAVTLPPLGYLSCFDFQAYTLLLLQIRD